MIEFAQFIISGLAVGVTYTMVALGFALIWKSSSVANLTLGQLILVFAWFAYAMLVQIGLPAWLGFFLVIVFALVMGWIIERVVLRPLIAQPILSLITVTLGIAYFLEGAVHFIWPWSVAALPHIFPAEPLHLGEAVIPQEYLWIGGISLVIFVALSLYFRFNKMGIAMRATADDQLAVQACGIPVTRIFSRSWMFACVVAAISGVLIASISGITYGLVETGLKAFSVVILGGLDSFIGAIVAGPIIGLAESLAAGYLTQHLWPGIKDIIPFIIIIIVMIIKPYGLFGEERIERI